MGVLAWITNLGMGGSAVAPSVTLPVIIRRTAVSDSVMRASPRAAEGQIRRSGQTDQQLRRP